MSNDNDNNEDVGIIDLTCSPSPSPLKKKKRRIINDTDRSIANAKNDDDDDNIEEEEDEVFRSFFSPFNFSILSYNIWFGEPHQDKRMQAISDAISSLGEQDSSSLPMFIGLQEVTANLKQMLFPLLQSLGYEVLSQDLTSSSYGCGIAYQSKYCKLKASGFQPYADSIMMRGILYVLVEMVGTDKKEILFTTTHLESFMANYYGMGRNYDGVKERRSQIQELRDFCDKCLNDRGNVELAIITGDLNWDDERKRSSGADEPLMSVISNEEWIDLWHEKNHNSRSKNTDDGFTYDAKLNQMLGGNLRRRFDRILLRTRPTTRRGSTTADLINIKETFMIGKDPISGIVWEKDPHPMAKVQQIKRVPVLPSDHYGLVAEVQIDHFMDGKRSAQQQDERKKTPILSTSSKSTTLSFSSNSDAKNASKVASNSNVQIDIEHRRKLQREAAERRSKMN